MNLTAEITTAPRFSAHLSNGKAPPTLSPEQLPDVVTPVESQPMRAVLHRQYGNPELLSVAEIARPIPGDDEVLVRVSAAGVSIGDHHIITGKPYVIRPAIGGLFAPGKLVPGATFAGRVEAVGVKVVGFAVGDEVIGQAPNGAYAEYMAVAGSLLAPKPRSLSLSEAAAVPWATTPLQALRDAAKLQPGERVLINGASGGVGTWAVQIAKAMGAHVTGVCSTRNAELVRALGADEVLDYTQRDFVTAGARFDVIFDTVGNRSLAEYRSVLTAQGRFVSCSGGNSSWRWLAGVAHMLLASLFTNQRLVPFIAKPNQADLVALTTLIDAGKAKPTLDKSYSLDQICAAMTHVGSGRTRGQVVVECNMQ